MERPRSNKTNAGRGPPQEVNALRLRRSDQLQFGSTGAEQHGCTERLSDIPRCARFFADLGRDFATEHLVHGGEGFMKLSSPSLRPCKLILHTEHFRESVSLSRRSRWRATVYGLCGASHVEFLQRMYETASVTLFLLKLCS